MREGSLEQMILSSGPVEDERLAVRRDPGLGGRRH